MPSATLKHPETAVWLIEANSGESAGTGVAVRMRHVGPQEVDGIYLITCAHVIRKRISESTFGPCYEKYWAYIPGSEYTEHARIPLQLVKTLTPFDCPDLGQFYRRPTPNAASHDWAILSIDAKESCRDIDPAFLIRNWTKREVRQNDDCFTLGYPGGRTRFEGDMPGRTNTVTPTLFRHIQRIETVSRGVFISTGALTNAGESGGGVFRGDGESSVFYGLHRARYEKSTQLESISAWAIWQRLHSLGYEPVLADSSRPVIVHSDWFLTRLRDKLFVGREEAMQQIAEMFLRSRVVVLTGLGGIGKSTLARQFSTVHAQDYDVLLYLNGSTPASIESGLANLVGCEISSLECHCDPAAPERVRKRAVEGWLARNTGWLLVVDGVDTMEARNTVECLMLSVRQSGHLLVTSRIEQELWTANQESLDVLSLDTIGESAGVDLLLGATPNRAPTAQDRDIAGEFSRLVGGLPLALSIVSGWVNSQKGKTLENCLIAFIDRNKKMDPVWASRKSDASGRSLEAAWLLSWEALSKDARELLDILAWMAPGKLARQVVWGFDGPEESLSELTRCSLIGTIDETCEIRIHSLVQEFARFRAQKESPESHLESYSNAVKMLCDAFPTNAGYASEWAACAKLRPHIESILSHLPHFSEPGPIFQLLLKYGAYLGAVGETAVAEPILEDALQRSENEFGPNSSEVALSLTALARVLQDTSRYREAGNLYLRAFEVQKAAFGIESPEASSALLDIYRFAKAWDGAQTSEIAPRWDWMSLLQQASSALELQYGRRSLQVADSLMCMGQELTSQGKHFEAEKHLRDSLDAVNELFPEHEELALARKNVLATALEGQGRQSEALDLRRDVMNSSRRIYGELHPQFAIAAANLAQHLKQEDPAEAERLYARAVETLGQFAGKNERWSSATQVIVENCLSFRLGQGDDAAEQLLDSLPASLFEGKASEHAPINTPIGRCLMQCRERNVSIKQLWDDPELGPHLARVAVELHDSSVGILKYAEQIQASSDVIAQCRWELSRALEILELYVGLDDERTLACRADYWNYSEWTVEGFADELRRNLHLNEVGFRIAARRVRLAWINERLDLLRDVRTRVLFLARHSIVEMYQTGTAAEFFCALGVVLLCSEKVEEVKLGVSAFWESVRRFGQKWSRGDDVSYFCRWAFVQLRILMKRMGQDETSLYLSLLEQVENQEFCQEYWKLTE